MSSSRESFNFLGIPNSDSMRERVGVFLANMRVGEKADQIPLLASILEDFLDEAIDTLVIGLIDAMQLHGVARKVVDVTVSTTRTTCHMLSKRVLRKMKNEDVKTLADYMEELRYLTDNGEGGLRSYTAIPIRQEVINDIDSVHEIIKAEAPTAHLPAIEKNTLALLDAAVEALYHRTMQTLKFGPIARKLVEMGYVAVSSGAHSMIKHVLPSLSDEQIRGGVNFFFGLLHRAESTPKRL